MHLVLIFLLLAVIVLIPFAFWGDKLESFFSQQTTVDWLSGYGHWAWFVAILLLASDTLLPLPATATIAALGFMYRQWLGWVV